MARRMMALLGVLLRSSLDHAGRQQITLAEELRFLEDYLMIERLRFADRLTVNIRVEEGARDALVPSFVLQPLVENAIRHGTGALLRPGHVDVCARRMDARLRIVSKTTESGCRRAGARTGGREPLNVRVCP
jgi:LytS/YehU family sensor histidine kinase